MWDIIFSNYTDCEIKTEDNNNNKTAYSIFETILCTNYLFKFINND